MKMYTNESRGGKFPPHHRLRGGIGRYDFFFLYPEYLTDVKVLVCPSERSFTAQDVQDTFDNVAQGDPEGKYPHLNLKDPAVLKWCIMKLVNQPYSYSYFCHATMTNDEYRGWVRGKNGRQNAADECKAVLPCDFSVDLDLNKYNNRCGQVFTNYQTNFGETVKAMGSGGGCTVYAMKEGIERFFITDINNPAGSAATQSNIPCMMDGIVSAKKADGTIDAAYMGARFNHLPGGGNVLFMDGHVEYVKYPGKYPATQYIAVEELSAGGGLGVLNAGNNPMDWFYNL